MLNTVRSSKIGRDSKMNLIFRTSIPVLVSIQLLLIIIHLIIFVASSYRRVDHGKQVDGGIIQKRSNNVDFYYIPTDTSADVTNRYPLTLNGVTKRVEFAQFSKCSIFRLSDDGQAVMVG